MSASTELPSAFQGLAPTLYDLMCSVYVFYDIQNLEDINRVLPCLFQEVQYAFMQWSLICGLKHPFFLYTTI